MMCRTTSINHAGFLFLAALFAIGSCTQNAPAHPSDRHTKNNFYAPEQILQICAQFPSLTACQEAPSSSQMEKRKSAYMRFGRAAPEAADINEEEFEQQPPEMEKRKSAYMRFGKRKSAYMRFGKRAAADQMGEMEKRKSAYMRFGKRSTAAEENMGENMMEKRKSAYMRFGKRR